MDLNVIIGVISHNNNVIHQRIDSEQIIKQKLERCKILGHKEVALAIVVDLTDTGGKKQQPSVPPPPNITDIIPSHMKAYTRITIRFSDPGQLHKVKTFAHKYDLIALQPLNAKMLEYVTTGNPEVDILSLDLSEKIENNFYKTSVKVLEERGVCIEINYGPAQLGSTMRRSVISNGQGLVEKSHKNIILSSGIDDIFRLRGPKDAKCLGVLFMLTLNQSHDAVFNNGQKAISCSKSRKNPVATVIELIKTEV